MFRKIITTTTIAAAAFVALGAASPAPASAGGFDCIVEPLHCIVEEITPDRDPVEPTPGIEVAVPGFVTGVGPGVLLPPQLPDSVIDAITDTPGLDLPSIELPLPVDTPEADASDEAPAVPAPAPAPEPAVPAPAPASDTPAPASSSDHGDHEASAPVAESTTADTPRPAPRSETVESVGSQDQTATVEDASDEVRTDETVDNDVSRDDEVTESLIDIATDVETGTGMDPIMAALLGMLGALGLMTIVAAAFRAGRKNS